MHDAPTSTLTVVGVAGDVTRSLTEAPIPEIYVPLAQSPSGFLTLQLRAHAGVSGLDVLPDAARAVLALDPELPLVAPALLEAVVAREGVRPRFLATVLAAFAALAAVVALIGVYAISAWVARQRRREAAVRLALGATPGSVVRALTQRGTMAVGVGLGAGWIGSIGLARLLADELTGVDAADPWIRAGTAVVLFCTCVLAIVWPARQVAVIDPASVFRE
jgi:ABC-type antimicrobial peptide transport system permease subunit